MAHGQDPDNPLAVIDRVPDAEAPDAILPESLHFPQERLTDGGITAEGLQGALDGTLQGWGKKGNDARDMGGMSRRYSH